MMGKRMPETCWAVFKRRAINLRDWCIWLVDLFGCMMMHGLIYIYGFQNVFLRCPTHRLHCFLSSHWSSFRFLSFMAFLIPSIQLYFGLPLALFCTDLRTLNKYVGLERVICEMSKSNGIAVTVLCTCNWIKWPKHLRIWNDTAVRTYQTI